MIFTPLVIFFIDVVAGILGSQTVLGVGLAIIALFILLLDLQTKEALALSRCAIASASIAAEVDYLQRSRR